jgi:hypothetical protein
VRPDSGRTPNARRTEGTRNLLDAAARPLLVNCLEELPTVTTLRPIATLPSAIAIEALGKVPLQTKLPPAPADTDPGAWPAPTRRYRHA